MKSSGGYRNSQNLIAWVALLAIPLSGMSIDIITPSLPAMAHYFSADKAWVQLSISSYMIGFAAAQLLAGIISDSIGRKKPFVIAMAMYIATTITIVFSHHIQQVLVLRCLQGIAVAFVSVPMRAVFADLFTGERFYKMINLMTLVWALGPIVAPAIGGQLQDHFGWQAPFYFLGLFASLSLVLAVIFIPETCKQTRPITLGYTLKACREMLSSQAYMTGIVCLSIMYSIGITFATIGPFLIQQQFHYTAGQFGTMALLMGLAWFLGNLTNRFLFRISRTRKITVSLLSMWLISIIMLLVNLLNPPQLLYLLLPIAGLLYFGGIVFPNYFAMCVALFPKQAATANALMGTAFILMGGLACLVSILLKAHSLIPISLFYCVIISLCCILYFVTTSGVAQCQATIYRTN